MDTEQMVTLRLPTEVYQHARRRAQRLQRNVEEMLAEALTQNLPTLHELPGTVVDDLAELPFLNDQALWGVARSTLPPTHQQESEELLVRNGQGILDEASQKRLDELVREYEIHTLRRAQAALLLKRRGYDLSDPAVLSTGPVPISTP